MKEVVLAKGNSITIYKGDVERKGKVVIITNAVRLENMMGTEKIPVPGRMEVNEDDYDFVDIRD